MTWNGPNAACRAPGASCSGCGGWSARPPKSPESAPAERPGAFSPAAAALRKATHQALAKVTDDIEKLHFNVCVAAIYEFANTLGAAIGDIGSEGADGGESPSLAADLRWAMSEAVNVLVQFFNPMMPHLAEECWAMLGHKTLVAQAAWPQVERDLLVEDTLTLPVQINGKKRAEITVPAPPPTPKSRLPFSRSMR